MTENQPSDCIEKVCLDTNDKLNNIRFIDYMSNYLKSSNGIPIERVTLKAADLAKLIQLALCN